MAKITFVLDSGINNDTLVSNFERPTSAKYATVQSISQVFQRLNSGGLKGDGTNPPSVYVSVNENQVFASGTFTLSSVVATDAISINGVTFTAVASGATGNQFNVGASDTETATNLAAAIVASATALVNEFVTATSAAAVVTVTAKNGGVQGNSITIASADATITASGARLTGGAVDPDAKTYSF